MAKELKQPESALDLETVQEVAEPPKSYRLQIVLILVCLILFQMIVLWMLLPSRKVIRENIGLNIVDGTGDFEGVSGVPPNIGQGETFIEKSISEKIFTVKSPRNEANETFSVEIRIGIRPADEKKFNQRYEKCMYEIQDRVMTILKASTTEDRMEAAFTTIKGKVKKAINEVLGHPWVQNVYCTNISLELQ